MPIKKVKSRKKEKIKGKGKKDGKQDAKRERESEIERAKANATLWEARCDLTENSRSEYQRTARSLSDDNRHLAELLTSTENNSLERFAVLWKKDLENEEKISKLEAQILFEKTKASQERDNLNAEYMQKIDELEEMYLKKCEEYIAIQEELKIVDDFQMKKTEMEKKLNNLKEILENEELEYKTTLAKMNENFLSKKAHLEKETEHTIAFLSEKAFNLAIMQLDAASRSIFKENVRLNKALSYHINEVEDLRRRNDALAKEINTVTLQKVTSHESSSDTTCQIIAQKKTLSELRMDVSTLEQALVSRRVEYKSEKAFIKQRLELSIQAGVRELDKLQKLLCLRERELSKVKRMSRSAVEKRTDMEIFFQEALDQVKQEILEQRKEAEGRKMVLVSPRRKESANAHTSREVTHSELKEPAKSMKKIKVSVSEMTWDEMERVLRLFFSLINNQKSREPSAAVTESGGEHESHESKAIDADSITTFLTQAADSSLSASVLPLL